jgi:hypothetical protein
MLKSQRLFGLMRPRVRPTIALSHRLTKNYMHIKDMQEEKLKAELQHDYDNAIVLEEYNRVYKPSYTLEFDRTGELVLYTCNPLKHKTIYFQYPYVFYESCIPLALFMYLANPLSLSYYASFSFFALANVLWFPRVWQLHSMQYRIKSMSLLRGGRYIKFVRSSIAGDEFVNWVEVRHFHPLTEDFKEFDDRDEADFLDEQGQLKYELGCELEHFKQWSVNDQDVDVFFMKEGVVHHPEVFEAVTKGYHVDTSDFVINTEHHERAREPHYNV